MPGALHAAISTTVAAYDPKLAPGTKPEAILAQALNAAAAGAVVEAQQQMTAEADGRQVELHTTTLVPHVGPGAVTMVCVLLFQVLPVVLPAGLEDARDRR